LVQIAFKCNFCNICTLLEQPLLMYIIVTGVWIECNVCVLFVQRELVHLCCVTCENTNITWYYVIPKNCHIVVSVCCTVHVKKSQCMQQLMDNCSVRKASVALQVQLLAL
jgi:hypothetical protein